MSAVADAKPAAAEIVVDSRPGTTVTARPTGKLAILKNRALATLMLGHFSVDMYSGVIPVLYPLLTDKFALSLSTVGLVSLSYSGMASLTQPLFGWIADRHGTRFIGLALAWTAIMFATIGFAPNFEVLLILAGLAGIGSGAYHPMGAVNARAVIDDAQRNTAMSIYVTGGTLGVASGPLVAASIFHFFDIHGTAVMLIPGLCAAIWMLFEMRSISKRLVRRSRAVASAHPVPTRALAIVIGMMALRSWTISGMQAYIPTWYKELGYSSFFYSALVTVLLISTALGTVGSGSLADRRGRRFPLIASSILSVPTILLFAQFPGRGGFVTAAMIGFLAASTLPLLLVIAQELMSGRAGLASGLIMGLGFTMSAIGVPITGAVADAWGIQNAMRFQAVGGAATIVFALMLPTEAKIRELTRKVSVSAAD
jgi:FSR family fosmidomycin resistance protein-like MFS transporter